jgi:hypothetical protein
MTKRAGKNKSPVQGKNTTGSKPGSRSRALKATGEPQKESFFWPELSKANEATAIKAGRGDQVKRLKDLRLELRAVNERWPVPQELRERMVFESARIAMSPDSGPKEKLWATRLLLAMDQANNKPRDLPTQIAGSANITVNQVLALIEGPGRDDELDLREFKVIPGGEDDYA